jgi:hypothetical protein
MPALVANERPFAGLVPALVANERPFAGLVPALVANERPFAGLVPALVANERPFASLIARPCRAGNRPLPLAGQSPTRRVAAVGTRLSPFPFIQR